MVLYVLDNDTNMMVAMSVCIGLVIEAWKITKVMDITVSVYLSCLLFVFTLFVFCCVLLNFHTLGINNFIFNPFVIWFLYYILND